MKKLYFFLSVFLSTALLAQERELLSSRTFTELEVHGNFEVLLRQGSQSEIIAASDDIGDIELDFDGERVAISWDNDWDMDFDREATLYITMAEIDEIDISGSVNLEAFNSIHSSNLNVRTSGSSQIELGVRVEDKLEIRCSGSSAASIFGTSTLTEVRTSGSSDLHAFDLVTRIAEIRSSGASNASIYALSSVNAKASGSSDIQIQGEAEIEATTSGAADITRTSKD